MTGAAGFTSILFPQGAPAGAEAASDCLSDLHLDEIIAAVTAGHPDDDVDRFFRIPLRDVFTIEHRHQVFMDLDRNDLRQVIWDFVGGMRTMRQRCDQADELRHRLQRQGWFIYAVQIYCDTVISLRQALDRVQPASPGLGDFARFVAEYADGQTFRRLIEDTRAVQVELRKVRYTVHIEDRRVHVEKYSGQTDYSTDAVASFERFATETATDYRVPHQMTAGMNHVERQILECVAKLYPNAFVQLDAFCRRNERFTEATMVRFDHEIRFYLYYLAFVRRFTTGGVSFSYPDVVAQPGVLSADHAIDLALAINAPAKSDQLIGNDFRLSDPEQILVITGPNQGGKTTFARTIGQCAYLASLGCPIPASRGRFTLPDNIFTHFERQESLATLHGKLEDELVRMHDILSRATATSLIILNESFSSTTVSDALFIATKVVRRVLEIRCTAVYVSFLDALASVDQACVSMVGEVAPDDPARRLFRFTRRPADGLAYAAALANKYGLTHAALRQRLSP